jgi:hypothetical protein
MAAMAGRFIGQGIEDRDAQTAGDLRGLPE